MSRSSRGARSVVTSREGRTRPSSRARRRRSTIDRTTISSRAAVDTRRTNSRPSHRPFLSPRPPPTHSHHPPTTPRRLCVRLCTSINRAHPNRHGLSGALDPSPAPSRSTSRRRRNTTSAGPTLRTTSPLGMGMGRVVAASEREEGALGVTRRGRGTGTETLLGCQRGTRRVRGRRRRRSS